MKFVALALALLLAVGSQAASLPTASAPSEMEHVKSTVDMYLTHLRDTAHRTLGQLDDDEFGTMKATLTERVNNVYSRVKEVEEAVFPFTASIVSTIAATTSDFYTTVMDDIRTLKTELEPQRKNLQEVVLKHIDEYSAAMTGIKTMFNENKEHLEALRSSLEPHVDSLGNKVVVNVEETKTALQPIVASVSTKLSGFLEQLKTMVSPYVEEYKDQLKEAYSQTQSISTDDINTLKDKIMPKATEVKAKLTEIFDIIADSVNKSA